MPESSVSHKEVMEALTKLVKAQQEVVARLERPRTLFSPRGISSNVLFYATKHLLEIKERG